MRYINKDYVINGATLRLVIISERRSDSNWKKHQVSFDVWRMGRLLLICQGHFYYLLTHSQWPRRSTRTKLCVNDLS